MGLSNGPRGGPPHGVYLSGRSLRCSGQSIQGPAEGVKHATHADGGKPNEPKNRTGSIKNAVLAGSLAKRTHPGHQVRQGPHRPATNRLFRTTSVLLPLTPTHQPAKVMRSAGPFSRPSGVVGRGGCERQTDIRHCPGWISETRNWKPWTIKRPRTKDEGQRTRASAPDNR